VTDERKEGQPRGSEALRESIVEVLELYKQDGTGFPPYHGRLTLQKAWKRVYDALAAATAERTTLATESPVAETVAIGAGDSHAGSQSHQTAERTPDDEWPPCCQEAHDIGLQMGRLEAKHDADRQPPPPQPEEKK
jgi:hypothetical protein